MQGRPPREHVERCRRCRGGLTCMVGSSRSWCCSGRFEDVVGDVSLAWRIVKDILCKLSKSEAAQKFVHEGNELTSADDFADEFNGYFVAMGPTGGGEWILSE